MMDCGFAVLTVVAAGAWSSSGGVPAAGLISSFDSVDDLGIAGEFAVEVSRGNADIGSASLSS